MGGIDGEEAVQAQAGWRQEVMPAKSLIELVDEAGDFVALEDGYIYFWEPHRGCLSAEQLREIADELDRRNKAWNDQVEKDLEQRPVPEVRGDGVPVGDAVEDA